MPGVRAKPESANVYPGGVTNGDVEARLQLLPNPHAAGFWQPLHGPVAGIGDAFGADAPTANAESCFSTRSLRHDGQAGVTPSRMSISKCFPHAAQLYS